MPEIENQKYRNIDISKILSNFFLQMYPGQDYNPPVAGVIAAWSASRFQYPTLDMLSSMYANQTFPIFMYEFNHVPSWVKDSCLNVTHSTELAFVFGGYAILTLCPSFLSISMRQFIRRWRISNLQHDPPSYLLRHFFKNFFCHIFTNYYTGILPRTQKESTNQQIAHANIGFLSLVTEFLFLQRAV